MIIFRTDGNGEIGSGHTMRCLSIAKALRSVGEKSIFVLSDNSMEAVIGHNRFESIVLNSSWNDLETEAAAIKNLVNELNPKKVVVDSYFATERYLKELSSICYLVYLDDFGQEVYPVNAVINYNISADEAFYKNSYDSTVKLMLGTRFAPLRDEFKNVEYEINKEVKNVFVSTGGADPLNVASLLASEFITKKGFEDISFQIIVGGLNPHIEELKRIAEKHKNLIINQNAADMAYIMKKCDIAISASGSTLYELCAVGVPTICYTFADNQFAIAKAFSKKRIMKYAGDFRNPKAIVLDNIANLLGDLSAENTRINSSRLSRAVVDGQGTNRISEFLVGE